MVVHAHPRTGDRLRARREELELSGRQVARDLDISAGTYLMYERGEAVPSVLRALRIAELLQCRVEELWG